MISETSHWLASALLMTIRNLYFGKDEPYFSLSQCNSTYTLTLYTTWIIAYSVTPSAVGQIAKRVEMNPMGSALTQLLKEESNSRGSTMKLTVYLPNYNPMEIRVNDAANIQKVIEHILSCHKEQGLRPPLKYDNPKLYELRMHDGE